MDKPAGPSYEFGRFNLNAADRCLLREHEPVPLTPKAFDILLTLVENAGQIVEKDDLMKRVWPNTFVEEGNLTQNVSLLRKALSESASGPQFIETVPRRGYRFVATVFTSESARTNDSRPLLVVRSAGVLPGTETATTLSLPAMKESEVEQNGSDRGKAYFKSLLTGSRRRISASLFTLAAVIFVVAAVTYFSGRGKATEGNSIQSIAVVPFVDDSPNEDSEYLDDKIAASLVNSLSKLPKLRVIPRSVMVNYKGRNVDPRQIGK
ncbi:MAG TPA: winged helix-turn-helix domain-containing protein [Pyrinomonadaceae bacterium]|nr:winged helix-turn-helix domain-containing protein [Pyrinomonadaceae bacterium]